MIIGLERLKVAHEDHFPIKDQPEQIDNNQAMRPKQHRIIRLLIRFISQRDWVRTRSSTSLEMWILIIKCCFLQFLILRLNQP